MSSRMVYPRECPGCGLVREASDFSLDSYQRSGRKSRCKACCNRAADTYHATVRKPRRLAALEAKRAAEMKVLEREHKKRVAAATKAHQAGARRQRELLKSLGVPDLTPEEVTERARRGRPWIRGVREG